jgi:hypothetical protein
VSVKFSASTTERGPTSSHLVQNRSGHPRGGSYYFAGTFNSLYPPHRAVPLRLLANSQRLHEVGAGIARLNVGLRRLENILQCELHDARVPGA